MFFKATANRFTLSFPPATFGFENEEDKKPYAGVRFDNGIAYVDDRDVKTIENIKKSVGFKEGAIFEYHDKRTDGTSVGATKTLPFDDESKAVLDVVDAYKNDSKKYSIEDVVKSVQFLCKKHGLSGIPRIPEDLAAPSSALLMKAISWTVFAAMEKVKEAK